ncbi:hypothetical protein OIV83_003449 [Microbotryomycetes sp. JL201]|nr:hypothetical protein OIV83_003449 [Microbotryomycetes sp. JL201]
MSTGIGTEEQCLVIEQRLATALLGPLYAGWSTQLLLYGVFVAVFVNYQSADLWSANSPKVRALLWTVAFLLTVQAGFCWAEIFWFGVQQNWTVERILAAHWPTTVSPLLTAIIGTLCTVYLTIRASAFFASRWARRLFCAVQFTFITVALVAAISVTAIGFLYLIGQEDRALPITFNMSVSIWLFCSMFVDVAVSLALLYNLRSRIAGFNPATDSLLRALVQTALRTAAYTALVSIAGAVVSVSFHEDDLYTTDVQYALWYPLSSLYGLSLFTTLYSRKVINRQLGHATGTNHNMTTGDMQNVHAAAVAAHRRLANDTRSSLGQPQMNGATSLAVADCYLCPSDDQVLRSIDSSNSRTSNKSKKIANLFVPHITSSDQRKTEAWIGQRHSMSQPTANASTMAGASLAVKSNGPVITNDRTLSSTSGMSNGHNNNSHGQTSITPGSSSVGQSSQPGHSPTRWTFASLGFGPAQPRVVRDVRVNTPANFGYLDVNHRTYSNSSRSSNGGGGSGGGGGGGKKSNENRDPATALRIQVHTTRSVEWEDEDGNKSRRDRIGSLV